MRTLAFDGRMGASGDMLLGALLAAGGDPAVLDPVEAALPVRYEVETVRKHGIAATSVDVLLDETGPDQGTDGDRGESDDRETDHDANGGDDSHDDGDHVHGDGDHAHGDGDGDYSHDGDHSQGGDGDHSHDGDHTHDHRHTHEVAHDHGEGTRAEGSGPTRSHDEVLEIVGSMDLSDGVEADARAIFEILADAEASVHGEDRAETHFHEVGADDAIADVVGAALLVEDIGPERVVTTPPAAGGGEVSMSHGTYPVPTPAVVETAERADWSLRGGPVEAELLTPTGAAVLAHYAEGVESLPDLAVSASGYGAGGWEFPERPNVLRAVVGDGGGRLSRDAITVLETNLDDATPEVLGGLQETLTEAGARDVTVLPATMKKSRPGHLVKVVVKPEDARRVARRLAEETGTLGVREHGAGHRWVADRHLVTATILVDGERHEVLVKRASDDAGETFDVSAEFDDALAVARELDLPVRDVARRAEAAVRDGYDDRLCHIVERERWESFADADEYTHPTLDEQGFVHLSAPRQVPGVARSNFPEADDPVVLVLDRERLDGVKYEEQPSGGYAHVYGPIPTDAVVDVLALPVEDGHYRLPEELREA